MNSESMIHHDLNELALRLQAKAETGRGFVHWEIQTFI